MTAHEPVADRFSHGSSGAMTGPWVDLSNVHAAPGRARAVVVAVLLAVGLLGACAGGDDSAETAATEPTASTTTETAPTTTRPPEPALQTITPPTTEPGPGPGPPDGEPGDEPPDTAAPPGPPPPVYELDWTNLTVRPYFAFDDETEPDDPFWRLNTDPDEGFLFAMEMYTTGFGDAWTGDTGEFDIGCHDASSGICVHLDPDTEADEPGNLNADFLATGTIRIDRLDDGGYDLTLRDVVFSDGSSLPGPTRLRGEPAGN
jgi:hypothetical protein